MIDQSAMQQVRVDTENKVVHVGAGATWGQVDVATYPRGLATPGGGCVEVGVAGLTQGGGFGPIARTHGLTLDNLLSVRIVTARDEKAIVADAKTNSKLFWALRGGGGGTSARSRSSRTGSTPSAARCWAGCCSTPAPRRSRSSSSTARG